MAEQLQFPLTKISQLVNHIPAFYRLPAQIALRSMPQEKQLELLNDVNEVFYSLDAGDTTKLEEMCTKYGLSYDLLKSTIRDILDGIRH